MRKKILVVDEAHNLENELSRFIEITVSQHFAENVLKIKMPKLSTQFQSFNWVKNVYLPHLTKVSVNREKSTISIIGDTKPFKSLIAEWSFIEQDKYCKVTFSLEVSFTSIIKEGLVSISFEKVASNILDAFERRARE